MNVNYTSRFSDMHSTRRYVWKGKEKSTGAVKLLDVSDVSSNRYMQVYTIIP